MSTPTSDIEAGRTYVVYRGDEELFGGRAVVVTACQGAFAVVHALGLGTCQRVNVRDLHFEPIEDQVLFSYERAERDKVRREVA